MLSIRDMTSGDLPVYRAFATDFYGGNATLFPIREENLLRTLEETLSPAPRARLLLLERAGKPVGYGNLAFTFSTEAGGPVCWVEEIYLRPEERGKGYGRAFLQWVLSEYAGQMARFRLEVCPSNPDARRLYAAVGFSPLPYDQMVLETK